MTPEEIKIDANAEIKVTHYESGKLKSKTTYVSGENHGMETAWDEDGCKAWESIWKNGKRHAAYTDWYESGQKKYEAMWANNDQHGVTVRWSEDGKKEREIYFIAGKEYARIEWDREGRVIWGKFSSPVNLKKIHKSKKSSTPNR